MALTLLEVFMIIFDLNGLRINCTIPEFYDYFNKCSQILSVV